MLTLTNAKELRERRRQLYLKADEIMERARRAARDLTDDEKRQVDELHDEIERLQRDIERIEKQYALDEYFSRSQGVISGLQDGQQRFWPLGDTDDGQELRALGPGESVRRYVEQTRPGLADEYRGLTVGRYLRAMVTGPKNEVEERALGHTGSAGGYTVPDILGAEIIDAMRAQSVTGRAGARTVPLDSDKHSFATLLTDPQATWRAENTAVTESDPTFGQVVFQPKTLAVLVKASFELIEDSLNIEQALFRALSASLALELDRVALMGSGQGNEPRGIANTTGIHTLDMGENGAPLTSYDPLLQVRGMLLAANANEPRAYIMHPRTETELSLLKTGLQGDKRQLPRPTELANVPFLATTMIPVNEQHGTAANATRIITGDFRDLWIGIRTSFQLEVLRERFKDHLQVGFLAFLRADVGVVRPKSFAQIVGIVPPSE